MNFKKKRRKREEDRFTYLLIYVFSKLSYAFLDLYVFSSVKWKKMVEEASLVDSESL